MNNKNYEIIALVNIGMRVVCVCYFKLFKFSFVSRVWIFFIHLFFFSTILEFKSLFNCTVCNLLSKFMSYIIFLLNGKILKVNIMIVEYNIHKKGFHNYLII